MDESTEASTTAIAPAAVTPTSSDSARQHMMYDANRKSAGVAFLLCIFLGMFGAHRFYLGESGTGAAQLIMTILGWLTFVLVVGIFLLMAVGIWVFVDLFLISGIVREKNIKLADSLTR